MIPTRYCRQILPPEECNYVEKLIKKPDMDLSINRVLK